MLGVDEVTALMPNGGEAAAAAVGGEDVEPPAAYMYKLSHNLITTSYCI